MQNFEVEIYKSLKTILYGNVTYGSETIPYFADSFVNTSKGIYISGYQEQEEDTKDRFGARCFVTIGVFTENDGVDVSNSIANSVRRLVKASVTSTITSSNISIVLTKSPRIVRFNDLDGGSNVHRVELLYEFLVYAIS